MRNLGRLDLVAANDTKSIINMVKVHEVGMGKTKKVYAVATNGYCMARREVVMEEGDELGMLPAGAVREYGRSQRGKKIARLVAGKEVITVEHPRWSFSKVFERKEEGTYPDYQTVLNPARDSKEKRVRFTINAELLLQLAEALQAEQGHDRIPSVELFVTIPDDLRKCSVSPIYAKGPAGEGVIMPIRG